MAYTYEQILEKLGDEAQPVAGTIIVNRHKNIVVAELTPTGGLIVTPEGEEILAEKPVKRSRKADTSTVDAADVDLDSKA